MKRHLRLRDGVRSVGGGLNLSTAQRLIGPSETPFASNFEFYRNTALLTGGSIKLNNQVAPTSGVLTRVPQGGSSLSYESGRSVPLRGYAYFPWNAATDIGPPAVVFEGDGTNSNNDYRYHRQRGVSFQKNISFRIPRDVRFYERDTRGDEAPSSSPGVLAAGAITLSPATMSGSATTQQTIAATGALTLAPAQMTGQADISTPTGTPIGGNGALTLAPARISGAGYINALAGTEPEGRPTLASIARPDADQFFEVDLFPLSTLQADGTYVVTSPIQIGHSINPSGGAKIEKNVIHYDPSDIAWPTAANGKRAIRFIWNDPGGQPRGILAPPSGPFSVQVWARQVDETSPQVGTNLVGGVGVEWVEFVGFDLYMAGPYAYTVGSLSSGPSAEEKPLRWWYKDCNFIGTTYVDSTTTGPPFGMKFVSNHFQTSCAYINCSWTGFTQITEHLHYHHGWARDWDGGRPFLWYEDCYIGICGSQHSKITARPCTAAIDAQYPPVQMPVVVPGVPPTYVSVAGDSGWAKGQKNPFRSHAVGTPWVGDALVAYFRCKFEDCGALHQRGPGNVVAESPCIWLLWIEDCSMESPDPNVYDLYNPDLPPPLDNKGVLQYSLNFGTDFDKLSGYLHVWSKWEKGSPYKADIWPWANGPSYYEADGTTPLTTGAFMAAYSAALQIEPDPTMAARGYSPGTGGKISQLPGIQRTVMYRTDAWSHALPKPSGGWYPMLRSIDHIGETAGVKSIFEVWECTFYGDAAIRFENDGLIWRDNLTPSAIARAEGRFGPKPNGDPYWTDEKLPNISYMDSTGSTPIPDQTANHFLGTGTDQTEAPVAATLSPSTAPVNGDWGTTLGYDEAFESTCLIIQKGGDRQSNLSWALGIVNVGSNYEHLGGAVGLKRVSNYALCFMWMDAPTFGLENSGSSDYISPRMMRYALGTESDIEANGLNSTTALRALLIPFFVEPGEEYRVSFGVKLDSGGVTHDGSGGWSSAWNEDGKLQFVCQKGYDDPTVFVDSDLIVWKGPQDSLDYLKKYGVRYHSKDAEFAGLGMRRQINSDINYDSDKQPGYFIPYGHDQAPLEMGGNRLVRRADHAASAIVTNHALTARHVNGNDTTLLLNHEGLVQAGSSIQVQGANPLAVQTNAWGGAGGSGSGGLSSAEPYHTESLRGYRLIATKDVKDGSPGYDAAGSIFSILDMPTWDTATIQGLPGFVPATIAFDVLVQAFRWNQFPLELSEYRHYREPLDFTDERAKLSLRQTINLEDSLDPGLSSLTAYYPLDDAGGGALRELMGNRSGYLAPFSMGTSTDGTRGEKRVFLSGEGEAVCLDLSENPIFEREFGLLLGDDTRGIGIELTMQLPEATYINQSINAPVIASWELRDPDSSGMVTKPQPLMRLTAGDLLYGAPAGFALQVDTGSDQSPSFTTAITDNYTLPSATSPWGLAGDWVGKTITVQFGLHPTGNTDEYYAYIAVIPKSSVNPEDGDASHVEYVARRTVIVPRKQLTRSFITIGGQLDTGSDGYDVNNVRVILDEVRVSAAPMPGNWPATMTEIAAGAAVYTGTNTARDGKLSGTNALPSRKLDLNDILMPLGAGIAAASVVDGDEVVTAPVGQAFFEGNAADTRDAVVGTFLIVRGDTYEIKKDETVGTLQEEFYAIKSVASGGATLNLYGPLSDSTRSNASAASFRLVGYTAFGTDTEEKQLTLGNGKAFLTGTTKAADALLSEDWWANQAPVTGNFKVRLFSPIGSGSLRDVVPLWTRGVQYPKRNPILGIGSIGETALATTRGALYEADDRWRAEGPNDQFTKSLELLGTRHVDANVGYPKAHDFVTFTAANSQIGSGATNVPGAGGGTGYYEGWVYLDDVLDTQTLLYIGDLNAYPSEGITERDMNLWLRISNGIPQMVVGSTATASPSTPSDGLFVASGGLSIKPRVWTHIRWYASGEDDILQVPKLTINGKFVSVTVSERDSDSAVGATSDGWLQLSLVPSASIQEMMVGAARDAFKYSGDYGAFAQDATGGVVTEAQDIHGVIHPLLGKLCGLSVVYMGAQVTQASLTDFDHNNVSSTTGTSLLRAGFQDGIGHHVTDASPPGQDVGLIHAHPAISINHELGLHENMSSFASFDNRVYIANGGRVVYTDTDHRSKFSGVRPPSTPATFSVDRKPLWVPNVSLKDPTSTAATGAGDQNNHYDGYGNTYLEQEWHDEMEWKKDSDATGEYGVFAFKSYWKPRSVSGRVALYTAREGKDSGGAFVESQDGKLVFGWYDTYLKKRVWVETSSAVFEPGIWHYIYVRKAFPQQDGDNGGNWRDSVWNASNSGSTRDSVVVRQFPMSSGGAAWTDYSTIFAKFQTAGAVSFTTDQHGSVSGTTATGLVTVDSVTYSASGSGTITAGTAGTFHPDMAGMYFQWGTGATAAGTVYRVASYSSGTQINVTDLQGGVVTLNESSRPGGVFIGIALVPSTNYDAATSPDEAPYPIRYFGTNQSGSILSGESAASGEFACPAAVVALTTTGLAVEVFQTGTVSDELERGTDVFEGRIWIDGTPNELSADGTATWSCIDTRPYGAATTGTSTQPNAELEVEMALEASVNALSAFWKFVQDPGVLNDTFSCRVAFFDTDQGEVSALGPPLLIEPSLEDASNPSGSTRLVIESLPVSREAGNIGRYVYLTAPGGVAYHLVAIVPDNSSSTVSIVLDVQAIQIGEPAQWNISTPPRCRLLQVVGQTLVYANLTYPDAPDAFMYSQAFEPARVPPANFGRFNTGASREITGMGQIRGYLVVMKRNSVHRALIANVAQLEDLVDYNGCVANQTVVNLDNQIVWLSEHGWVVYRGTGIPTWIGAMVQDAFNDEDATIKVDRTSLSRCSAAVNSGNHVIELACRIEGAGRMRHRWTLGIDSRGMVRATGAPGERQQPVQHGLLEGPNVTALGSVDRRGGGTRRLVGGTEEGFFVWLDRTEAYVENMGTSGTGWGDLSLTAGAGGTTTAVPIKDGRLDQDLEGPRGSTLAAASPGTEARVILAATTGSMLLDRAATTSFLNDEAVYVGPKRPVIHTGWMDMVDWSIDKIVGWLDLEFEGSSGQLYVEVYTDLDDTTDRSDVVPEFGEVVTGRLVVDIAQGWAQLNLCGLGPVRYLKIKLLQGGDSVDQRVEVVGLGLRGRDADVNG